MARWQTGKKADRVVLAVDRRASWSAVVRIIARLRGQQGDGSATVLLAHKGGTRAVNVSFLAGRPPDDRPGVTASFGIHVEPDNATLVFQKELTSKPNLAGRVVVRFTIGPTGQVVASSIRQTTMNDRTVEQCIAQAVRTWRFPKPRGGGIVIVDYPFVLRTAP